MRKALVVILVVAHGGNHVLADVVKVNPQSGHEFTLLSAPLTWQDARVEAAARGGYLASITSQSEQDWIVQEFFVPYVVPQQLQMWLGATDEVQEGTWLWDSGEAFLYTNWAPGEPSNRLDVSGPGQPGEDYLSMWDLPRGTWNDYPGPNYYSPVIGYQPAPLLGWVLIERVPTPGTMGIGCMMLWCASRRRRP